MSWGIILVNLGSPAAPTKSAYRQFLKQFLGDPRVVEVPRPLWWLILNLFILPFRPAKVAKTYASVWLDGQGSPLTVITRRQVEALNAALRQQRAANAPPVTYAMTYGGPALAQRIAEFQTRGVERILVVPLFPQYSATTTAPIYDQYAAIIKTARNIPDVWINKCYYRRDDYLHALAQTVGEFRAEHGAGEKLLLSFHGIPRRNVELGDPYFEHCRYTATQVAARLQLAETQWEMSFQSRFGPAQWLQPYTVDVLTRWGEAGVKRVDVICPAFAADCLETLEEIAVEANAVFQAAGGDELRLIPCLNDHPAHIAMLSAMVEEIID